MKVLRKTLLAVMLSMADCGQNVDENKSSSGSGDDTQEIENCCYCLVTNIYMEFVYYDDIYCFDGDKYQCVTALANGGSITSYNKCFHQLCAGDCWFLEKE